MTQYVSPREASMAAGDGMRLVRMNMRIPLDAVDSKDAESILQALEESFARKMGEMNLSSIDIGTKLGGNPGMRTILFNKNIPVGLRSHEQVQAILDAAEWAVIDEMNRRELSIDAAKFNNRIELDELGGFEDVRPPERHRPRGDSYGMPRSARPRIRN